jgi:hypothetical protein
MANRDGKHAGEEKRDSTSSQCTHAQRYIDQHGRRRSCVMLAENSIQGNSKADQTAAIASNNSNDATPS